MPVQQCRLYFTKLILYGKEKGRERERERGRRSKIGQVVGSHLHGSSSLPLVLLCLGLLDGGSLYPVHFIS